MTDEIKAYREKLLAFRTCENCGGAEEIDGVRCQCFYDRMNRINKGYFIRGREPLPDCPVTPDIIRMYLHSYSLEPLLSLQPRLVNLGPGKGKTVVLASLYNTALMQSPHYEIFKISEIRLFRVLREDEAYSRFHENFQGSASGSIIKWVMIDNAFHALNWEPRGTGGDKNQSAFRNYADWIETLYDSGAKMICAGEKPEVWLSASNADQSLLRKLNALMRRSYE